MPLFARIWFSIYLKLLLQLPRKIFGFVPNGTQILQIKGNAKD